MNLPIFPDYRIKINIGAMGCGDAGVECRGRLASRLANLLGFESALDHVGDRAVFTRGKPMREVARLGAAD